MFEQLPETNPNRNNKKLRAFVAAVLMQAVLVSAVIVVQMVMPESLGRLRLLETLYMAPPPPPPAPAPAPAGPPPKVDRATRKEAVASTPVPTIKEEVPQPVEHPVIAPTTIPKDIAGMLESPPSSSGGIPGGVPGGVPGGSVGGIPGGIPGGVIGGAANAPLPPPKEPVRVGGNVREPRVVKLVEPKYPPVAARARVQGVVILEAVVTEQGNVEKLKLISGPPLLVQAAMEAVQNWKYEPTILNGQPVPVILTAKVNFSLGNQGK
ncbi:MAG TPA: TonB family protein [Terriglobia bacterium]|nr:TonB family protein [Terriglobia bacterium]